MVSGPLRRVSSAGRFTFACCAGVHSSVCSALQWQTVVFLSAPLELVVPRFRDPSRYRMFRFGFAGAYLFIGLACKMLPRPPRRGNVMPPSPRSDSSDCAFCYGLVALCTLIGPVFLLCWFWIWCFHLHFVQMFIEAVPTKSVKFVFEFRGCCSQSVGNPSNPSQG